MTRRVAVVYVYPTVAWIARCTDGVRRYAHEQGNWEVLSSPSTRKGGGGALALPDMRGWKGDGIVAATDDERELRIARKMGVPVVNLASRLPESLGVPRVTVNHWKVGRLAADHLLSRGLRHLAFFGWKDAWYADQRRLGFIERAAEAGVKCDVFLRNPDAEAGKNWLQRIVQPAKWLSALPRPCGVLALHDHRAQFLMEACQEAKLQIPEDIALIGIDNEEAICEHSLPTLTSVSRNSERVGWEAAALLDRMMRGEPAPADDVLVDPDGVVARQSTDMLYCSDALARRALDYMRTHLARQFNIEHLAEHLAVSKRTLETRFRGNFQSSPHDFLTCLRVQHAKALMQGAEKRTLEQVALDCGFGSVRAFYRTFRRATGESLGAFRKRSGPKLTSHPG